MFKQLLLPLFSLFERQYLRRDYASLIVQTPLEPLLTLCSSSVHTTREAYACQMAREVKYVDRDDHVSLDVMPEFCGGPGTAYSEWIEAKETIANWWRPYNLSEPFRSLIFGNNAIWKDVQIHGDWMQVKKTLDCLERIQPATLNTTTLYVDVTKPEQCGRSYCSTDTYTPTYGDVEQTASSILSVIHHLPNLHTLRLRIPEQAHWFSTALSTNQTEGNSTSLLRSVSLGPSAHPVLAHTPHVRNVSLSGWQQSMVYSTTQDELIAAIKNHSLPLEHLEVWDVMGEGKLADIARDIPTLTSLDLSNSNVPLWDYSFQLQTLVPHLALFTNVTTLSLPEAETLDPKFNPPWCGTIYIDNPGYYETVAREHRESIDRLTQIVKEQLKGVRRVKFGCGEWHDILSEA